MAPSSSAPRRDQQPLYVFCGPGDHLWVAEREPVDSHSSIKAMFEWMAETYNVRRMYWRAGQAKIWDEDYQVGRETPLQYDWARRWKHHLLNDVRINEAAVASAKRHGMEIFLYTGLFEHGVQPDVGIVCPYLFADRLRIEHPEWCMVDRWGERRCPGPISFCYPEAREALSERYVRHVTENGYDGINFYTYVENVGIRYLDEFGFNEPIVQEFSKQFPGVDLRKDELTDAQKRGWYECRGRFVTDFLRELHAALKQHGKKLSVILDSKNPDYPQPWWGKEIPGTGNILMDWETWIDEGIVDELWVQLGAVVDQQALLDRLLAKCEGTPTKLTARVYHPFEDPSWAKYVDQGVTLTTCITSPVNDIERYTLEPTSVDALRSDDWRLRAQTLGDIAEGELETGSADVARLARDPHVLVRRKAMHALRSMKAADQLEAIEAALTDTESSVRIAAAAALIEVHGPNSPKRILSALEHDHHFQFKLACVEALGAMGKLSLPVAIEALGEGTVPQQEVCCRALYDLGKGGLHAQVYEPLRRAMVSSTKKEEVRYWAIEGLVGLRQHWSDQQCSQFLTDLTPLVESEPSTMVQLHAAWAVGYLVPRLAPEAKSQALAKLGGFLRAYGDDCRRSDAAFGWRVVGNAILMFHQPGRDLLEAMRSQSDDKWLAWIAYNVQHVPQRSGKMELCTEREAVGTHAKYAPTFPGYRKW